MKKKMTEWADKMQSSTGELAKSADKKLAGVSDRIQGLLDKNKDTKNEMVYAEYMVIENKQQLS